MIRERICSTLLKHMQFHSRTSQLDKIHADKKLTEAGDQTQDLDLSQDKWEQFILKGLT